MSLRTSETAKAAGVNKETLRYYERKGLLRKPDRSPGGHRRYDARDVQTLRIIKVAQRVGFTLEEVASLLGVRRRSERDPGFLERSRAKVQEVETRISDLEAIRATLLAALDAGCDDLHLCATAGCCPLPFAEVGTGKTHA